MWCTKMMGEVFKRTIIHVLVFVFSAVIIISILVVLFVWGKELIKEKLAQAISDITPW